MADTFTQQLVDAREERPALIIPVVSLLGTSALFSSLVRALQHSLVLSAWYHEMFGGGRH